MDVAVVIWIVAAVVAAIAALFDSPYSARLVALALGLTALGLAVQAA